MPDDDEQHESGSALDVLRTQVLDMHRVLFGYWQGGQRELGLIEKQMENTRSLAASVEDLVSRMDLRDISQERFTQSIVGYGAKVGMAIAALVLIAALNSLHIDGRWIVGMFK